MRRGRSRSKGGTSSRCGWSGPGLAIGSEVVRELVAKPALEAVARARWWLPAVRAGDVGLEQPLVQQRGSLGAAGDNHDFRVAIEGPCVEVDRAEAGDVVGDHNLGVYDRAGELPDLRACREQLGVAVPQSGGWFGGVLVFRDGNSPPSAPPGG